MVREKATVRSMTDLDLRPVGILCDAAVQFKSKILLQHGNLTVNAKSVLGMLGSGIHNGDEVELVCDGEDEEKALETMLLIIEEGLGDY